MNYKVILRELESLKENALNQKAYDLVNKIQKHIDIIHKFYKN